MIPPPASTGGAARGAAGYLFVDRRQSPVYHGTEMRRRDPYARTRRKQVAVWLVSVVLFIGVLALAFRLAALSVPRLPRAGSSGSGPPPRLRFVGDGETVRFRGEIAPGREQEFEIRPTPEGLLIRPTSPGPGAKQ